MYGVFTAGLMTELGPTTKVGAVQRLCHASVAEESGKLGSGAGGFVPVFIDRVFGPQPAVTGNNSGFRGGTPELLGFGRSHGRDQRHPPGIRGYRAGSHRQW